MLSANSGKHDRLLAGPKVRSIPLAVQWIRGCPRHLSSEKHLLIACLIKQVHYGQQTLHPSFGLWDLNPLLSPEDCTVHVLRMIRTNNVTNVQQPTHHPLAVARLSVSHVNALCQPRTKVLDGLGFWPIQEPYTTESGKNGMAINDRHCPAIEIK